MVAGAARPRSGRCADCAYWSDARADGVPDAYGACARDADAPRVTRADSVHSWDGCWVPLRDVARAVVSGPWRTWGAGRERDLAECLVPLRGGGR